MAIIAAQRDAIESLLFQAPVFPFPQGISCFSPGLLSELKFQVGEEKVILWGVSVHRSAEFPQNVAVLGEPFDPSKAVPGDGEICPTCHGQGRIYPCPKDNCQAFVLVRDTTKEERKIRHNLQEVAILLKPVRVEDCTLILEPTDHLAFYTRV